MPGHSNPAVRPGEGDRLFADIGASGVAQLHTNAVATGDERRGE